jgi:hypothetical protein
MRCTGPCRASLGVKYVPILWAAYDRLTYLDPEENLRKLALRVTWPSFGNATVNRDSIHEAISAGTVDRIHGEVHLPSYVQAGVK